MRHMNCAKSFLLVLSLSITAALTAEELHPEVQAALDWQLPTSECAAIRASSSRDPTTEARNQKRAIKKREKCVKKYRELLVGEFGKLQSVAAHGLTKKQADVILGHMRTIQEVIQQSAPPQASVSNVKTSNVPTDTRGFIDQAHGR